MCPLLFLLCLAAQSQESSNEDQLVLPKGAGILHVLVDDRPDHFGWGIVGLGDVDADGKPDMYVGARCGVSGLTQLRGYGSVFSGKTGKRLYRVEGEDDAEGDAFGPRAFRVADVDGDGADDLAVKGEPMSTWTTYVKLHSGRTGALIKRWDNAMDLLDLGGSSPDTKRKFALTNGQSTRVIEFATNETKYEFKGQVLALTSDVDADKAPDLLGFAGNAWSLGSGVIPIEIRSSSNGTLLKSFEGPKERGRLRNICVAGDVDGDGFVDLAFAFYEVGRTANRSPALEERFHIVLLSGKDGTVLRDAVEEMLDPGDLHDLRNVGDMDGDGVSDLFVGQRGAVAPSSARARIYSGKDGHVIAEFTCSDSSFGVSAGNVGDIDGDGWPEIVVGQHESGRCQGRATVISLGKP